MLTKEECINALSDLKNQLEDILGEESENIECLNVLNQLINEHFKLVTKYDLALNDLVEMEMKFDNPPLKWEELKPNMRVWDNEMKEWIQIVHLTNFLGATKFVNFYINGLSELIDSEYEPNRFYRKEVVQE